MSGKVAGLNNVLSNLNAAIDKIEGGAREGLFAAGLFIQGEAVIRTPVRHGFLQNSAATQMEGDNTVIVFYTASYAPYVHENLEANFRKGQARFLSAAMEENEGKILDIIQEHSKV